jgi:Peptidase family M28
MACKGPIESYPPPDKRKTPRISPGFLKRARQRGMRKSTIKNNFISSQVDLVSRNNISDKVNSLTTFHNRHSKSQNINVAAEWIMNELKQFDSNVTYHEYVHENHELKNVVYHKQGATDKTLLFCAHYDTILNSGREDIAARAPGANDNASGVSSLLEISRIISKLDFESSLRFVFFSGEEQGLWGSTHYAQLIKEKNEHLSAVINMDMCAEPGFLASNRTTYVDIDDGSTGTISTNNEPSQILGEKMEEMAIDYVPDLCVDYDPIDASDYMPFEARGYVCIGAYDGSAVSENSHYHSETDLLSNLDIDLLTSVTKMVLAFALSEGKVKDFMDNTSSE